MKKMKVIVDMYGEIDDHFRNVCRLVIHKLIVEDEKSRIPVSVDLTFKKRSKDSPEDNETIVIFHTHATDEREVNFLSVLFKSLFEVDKSKKLRIQPIGD